MPQLIDAGLVYAAVPPLFMIKNARGANKYFTTNADLAKYGQQLFIKQHTLTNLNKQSVSAAEITKIFSNNFDYARDMTILGNTLAVDPNLLELVLFEVSDVIEYDVQREVAMAMAQKTDSDRDDGIKLLTNGSIHQAIAYSIANLNYKTFKQKIEKKYRFLKVDKDKSGIIRIQGLVGELYQFLFLNDHTIELCMKMIHHIGNSPYRYFNMDGKPVTMFTLINTLDRILPGVSRLKGIGEQKPGELKESTMDPGKRTLIRYTIESAKEEIENIRYIDSNKAALLHNLNITRQDLE